VTREGSTLTTLLQAKQVIFTTSARAAIALALEQLRVGPGDEVLLPAYHCLAMREPILAAGAQPVFYRLDRRLEIDLADVEARITSRTRALITVHFFGFPQQLDAARRMCDKASIALIEDCAHTFYGLLQTPQIGGTGDFAVGSLMKFFPVYDGGCLVSSRRAIQHPRLTSRGMMFQAKAVVMMIENAAAWGDSQVLKLAARLIGWTVSAAKKARPELKRALAAATPGAASGSLGFEPEWVHARMSAASRLVFRFAHHRRSVQRRRATYAQYSAALTGIAGGQPLRTDLPDGVVPYVFPFLLSAPETSFNALRAAGVPLYRWEDVADDACAIARQYKPRLVQFPCHQSLRHEEVADLIRTVTRVLAECERPGAKPIADGRA
jgi:dTDP-4-amino-4,6-dideoxygalactose transaminase